MTAARTVVALLVAFALLGCNGSSPPTYQGWIEADLVFVGPDESGRVETLSVREGMQVETGAPLFTVDADLQKADLAVAQSTVDNARQAFERAKTLLKIRRRHAKGLRGCGDVAAHGRSAPRLRAHAPRRGATYSARRPERSSKSISGRARSCRPGVRWFRCCRPGNIKVRFFVPEAVLPKIALGDAVMIRCDGCAENIPARISFISRTSEFTPPVIYSQEERSKLVFLVEARTERTDSLRVGQPVSVVLAGKEEKK